MERSWGFPVYVCNVTKNALGLTGVTNPTQEQLDAAVTATGYTGFVSLEYHVVKAGETPEPEPEPDGGEGGGEGRAKRAKK